MSVELEAQFPLLSPLNEDLTRFLGYISVGDEDYQISIILERPDCLRGAEVYLDSRLEPISSHDAAIRQMLCDSQDLSSFLRDLTEIIANRIKHSDLSRRSIDARLSSLTATTDLIGQLEDVGWEFVSTVNSDLSRVTLVKNDFAGRPQELVVIVPPRFPVTSPAFSTQLPVDFDYDWKKDSSLSSLFDAFAARVEDCREFWAAVKSVDDECLVLEPACYSPSATFRRIAIDQAASISLLVDIDPLKPFDLPETRFLGPDHLVKPFRLRLQSRAGLWTASSSIPANLSAVLEVTFPSKSNASVSSSAIESSMCGICYSFSIATEEGPSVVCNDEKCAQAFHKTCLFEWLKALPDCRESFNTLYGECPYCSHSIKIRHAMSSIPFSSHLYGDDELETTHLRQLVSAFGECRRRLELVKTSHLNPLGKEWRVLERLLARHAVPLRHEKGVRMARRVVQCVKRVFRHADADVVKMADNLLDLCRVEDSREKEKTLPSRQTCQHFLAALRRVLDLYVVCHSHAVDAYAYFSRLLTVGHLVPAFLCFAAAVARVAVLTRALVAVVGRCYDDLRPKIGALKGEDADLAPIYGENALTEVAPSIAEAERVPESRNLVLRTKRHDEEVGCDERDKNVGTQKFGFIEEIRQVEIEEEDVGEVVTVTQDSSFVTKNKGKKRKADDGESRECATVDAGPSASSLKKKRKKKNQRENPSKMNQNETPSLPAIGKTGEATNSLAPRDLDALKVKPKKRKSQSLEEIARKSVLNEGVSNTEFDEIDAIFGEKITKKKRKLVEGKIDAMSRRGKDDLNDASMIIMGSRPAVADDVPKSKKKRKKRALTGVNGEATTNNVVSDPISDEIDDIFGDFL